MRKKLLIIVVLILIAGLGAVAIKKYHAEKVKPPVGNAYVPNHTDSIATNQVLLNVPFTAQAPNGNWSDPKQEDGCEEASVLMAWLWIENKIITKDVAEKTIVAMSDFEQEH